MDVQMSSRKSEKFIPHPILDDPTKMMRIIANPVYDKLTVSRAGHIRKRNTDEHVRKSVRMNKPEEKTMLKPLKALNNEETIITPLPTNNNQSQPKSVSKRQNLPPIPLLTRPSTNRILPKNPKLSAHSKGSSNSKTSSNYSSLLENDKTPITGKTIRYVKSLYGFEVQRYSSPNWLCIDLLTKDACESEEKTFREMLDKKEQNELSGRNIYTSEYYRQRWEDLLESYKEGHLTHDEWAKQNYQLHCLKRFYTEAFEREQYRMDLYEQNQRQKLAKCVFNEWKEAKVEGTIEGGRSPFNTVNSQSTTEGASVLLNPPYSLHNNKTNRMSLSSIAGNDLEELRLFRRTNPSKKQYMLDEQRWSLNAMLKRVVGLAEPLSPLPKIVYCQHSSLTHLSNDSGFESSH